MSLTKSAAPFTGLMAGDTVHFCLDVASPAPLADIVWVIDVSNSMQAGINNIIANINIFTANLSSRGLNYRQGLFIYTGDTFYWYYHWFGWAPTDAQFSTDLNDSLSYIYGGIEWSLEALQYADGMVGWRPGASRTMILITDEGLPCAETGYQYPMDASVGGPWPAMETITGTAAILTADGVTVHSISKPWPWDTDPEHRCDPQDLPPASGGLWLDYSTPPAGWNTMLDQIASAIQGKSTLSVRDPIPPQVVPIAGTWCCGGALAGNELSWTVSGYASGQLLQFCFDGLVTTPWAWGSTITNTGYAMADAIPEFASNPWPLTYATPTLTVTPTDSPTCTDTPTDTLTPSPTQTASSTSTATPSASSTPTHSPTLTCTPTSSLTSSPSPTCSASPTPTSTITGTYTATATDTVTGTPSPTPTHTSTFTATPSITVSPTFTDSATITPTPVSMPFHVVVTVYNEAGEVVKHLYTGSSEFSPGGFTLDLASFVARSGEVTLNFPGRLQGAGNSLVWAGENDKGQAVVGGVYYLNVESKDSFGRVHSWAKSVNVPPAPSKESFDIYNSAGELVNHLDSTAISALALTDFGFGGTGGAAFALGPGEGVTFMLRDSGGNLISYVWDGRNSLGTTVAPGSYIARLVNDNAGRQVVVNKGFVIVGDAEPESFQVLAAPNPLGPGDRQWVFTHRPLGAGQVAVVKVYNLAGELVGQAAESSGAGQIVLGAGNRASGIYVAVFELREGNAVKTSRILRLAVAR